MRANLVEEAVTNRTGFPGNEAEMILFLVRHSIPMVLEWAHLSVLSDPVAMNKYISPAR
jgi:hypothetical protein